MAMQQVDSDNFIRHLLSCLYWSISSRVCWLPKNFFVKKLKKLKKFKNFSWFLDTKVQVQEVKNFSWQYSGHKFKNFKFKKSRSFQWGQKVQEVKNFKNTWEFFSGTGKKSLKDQLWNLSVTLNTNWTKKSRTISFVVFRDFATKNLVFWCSTSADR